MTQVPSVTGKALIAVHKNAGFHVVRIEGSHHSPRRPDGRAAVAPVHSGETIGPGLLAKVLRDCELTREQLRALLQ